MTDQAVRKKEKGKEIGMGIEYFTEISEFWKKRKISTYEESNLDNCLFSLLSLSLYQICHKSFVGLNSEKSISWIERLGLKNEAEKNYCTYIILKYLNYIVVSYILL